MSILIDETTMTSSVTTHYAELLDDAGQWRVSWLPGRVLSRNQAITAMTLAETVAQRDLFSDGPMWPFVDQWAAELDLTGPDAVVRASEPPSGTADGGAS